MKYFKTYESFKKSYGQKISPTDFKKIEVGKNLLYMGSQHEVVGNDGYVLRLRDKDGKVISVNLGQFNHGGMINEAAYVPSNIASFAKDRGVLADVKQIARWAEKAGKRIYGGTAIGKGYDTLILDLTHQGAEIYFDTYKGTIKVNGQPVTDWKSFSKAVNESTVNEARSIEKIERERTGVINDMAEVVTNWKAAKQSGDKQAEASFLQRLKDLTAQKKNLEKELNTAISGKDRYVELVISEGVMSEIDLLAKQSKDFKQFLKAFKTDGKYKGLDTAGDVKEFEDWLKTVYDNAKNESMNEAEVTKKTFLELWQETYGENFIKEYPAVAKVLHHRPNAIDRREIARIWDETYGEDFKEEYPGIWDKLD